MLGHYFGFKPNKNFKDSYCKGKAVPIFFYKKMMPTAKDEVQLI
jgi:hypothetical protein